LIGPVIGAVAVNALKSWATRAYPDWWLIILGVTFILVVLFMPKGIVGLPAQIKQWLQRFKTKTPEESTEIPNATAP
jgi:ABC-type branched-subunit amino acid transport system permease subunit